MINFNKFNACWQICSLAGFRFKERVIFLVWEKKIIRGDHFGPPVQSSASMTEVGTCGIGIAALDTFRFLLPQYKIAQFSPILPHCSKLLSCRSSSPWPHHRIPHFFFLPRPPLTVARAGHWPIIFALLVMKNVTQCILF